MTVEKMVCTIYHCTNEVRSKRSKYCESCYKDRKRDIARVKMARYRLEKRNLFGPPPPKRLSPVLVKGHLFNSKGQEDSQYKTGISYFMSNRLRIKELRNHTCERCSKDLKEASRWHWCIHHKDHDRTNNCDENFELLCKRCHQIEHNCIAALQVKSVETSQEA